MRKLWLRLTGITMWKIATTGAIFLASASLLLSAFLFHRSAVNRERIADNAEATRVALCSLHDFLEVRITQNIETLAQTTQEFEATQLRQTIAQEKYTVAALRSLNCLNH